MRTEVASYQARVEATPARESELIALTRDYETLQNSIPACWRRRRTPRSRPTSNGARSASSSGARAGARAADAVQPQSPAAQPAWHDGRPGVRPGSGRAAGIPRRDVQDRGGRPLCLSLPVLAAIPVLAEDDGAPRHKTTAVGAFRLFRWLVRGVTREVRELVFTRVVPPPFAPRRSHAPAAGATSSSSAATCLPQPSNRTRKLAAALHHAQVQHGTKVVMMASTLAGEGKTLTATNLALTLSESYRRRVALIDADLRRPTVHDMFGLPNVSGLNDVLSAHGDAACEIFEVSPCLSVLTAGRPNPDPVSGLTSERMRRVVAAASKEFEWVILDTPPVGLLPDAGLLGGDGGHGRAHRCGRANADRMVHRTVEAIGRDRIFGVVLNRAAIDPLWGGYGSYYYQAYGSDQ